MYLTAGNALVNPSVGLLFIDFERRRRLRLNGVAAVADDDPLLAEYPEAQLVVRVEATEVFPNCPRYIHEYRLVRRSRFVPREDCRTPVPAWKTREWASDVARGGRRRPRSGRRDRRAIVPRVFASRRFPDRVRAELERSFELEVHDSIWPPTRDELLARRGRARTG